MKKYGTKHGDAKTRHSHSKIAKCTYKRKDLAWHGLHCSSSRLTSEVRIGKNIFVGMQVDKNGQICDIWYRPSVQPDRTYIRGNMYDHVHNRPANMELVIDWFIEEYKELIQL